MILNYLFFLNVYRFNYLFEMFDELFHVDATKDVHLLVECVGMDGFRGVDFLFLACF